MADPRVRRWRTCPGRTLALMVEPAADHAGDGDVRRRRVLSAAPWVLMLLAVGVVQAVRAQWVDAALFLFVAAGLALDASGVIDRIVRGGAARQDAGGGGIRSRTPVERIGRTVAWAAVAIAAGVLVVATRHGFVAGVFALLFGVLAVVIAWAPATSPPPSPERRTARRRAALLWVSVVVAASVWELSTFIVGRIVPSVRPDFPSLSEIVDPLLDQPAGRAVFVVVWLGLGGFLLTRARARVARSVGPAPADPGWSTTVDAPRDLEG